MTNEQAIKKIQAIIDCDLRELNTMPQHEALQNEVEALDMAIKALEQQPSDCVSKAEVLKQIKEWRDCEFVKMTNSYHYLEKRIQSIQPATPTQRWIPVSERLPEDRNIVLVTAYWHETYQVMMASYFGEGLWWCVPFNNCGEHMQRLKPKAWQPLPKPYEEKRGSENG